MKILLNIVYSIVGIAIVCMAGYQAISSIGNFSEYYLIPIILTLIWGGGYLLFGLNLLKINRYANISLFLPLFYAGLILLIQPSIKNGDMNNMALGILGTAVVLPVSLIFLGVGLSVAIKNIHKQT